MNFSQNHVKEENKDQTFLEKELKKIEKKLTNFQTNQYYLECKQKLQNIYTKNVNGRRIKSKCNWYKNKEKSQLNSFGTWGSIVKCNPRLSLYGYSEQKRTKRFSTNK